MARTFQNEQALASAPIGPLMLRLAAPAVAAQLINVLYNIVDRIYIGHIAVVGKTALTGVGVTFPILTLISAFSAFALRAGGTVAGGGASGRLALSGRPACANSFATTLLSCQLFSRGVIPRATKIRS